MVDYLVAATLSNLLVSTILAALAWVVQRKIASPGLMNLLWAVVLIKLVTPPIVAIPALIVPSVAGSKRWPGHKSRCRPRRDTGQEFRQCRQVTE